MFTGIVEAVGLIASVENVDGERQICFDAPAPILSDTGVGDSVSVNGVCLTVTALQAHGFSVNVSSETASCTTLGALCAGDKVNLERALKLEARLGGHLISGHVDATGVILERRELGQSQRLEIEFPRVLGKYICRKGAICVDGVSLTINETGATTFGVNVIPHTLAHTIFPDYRTGQRVNLEIDIVARYLEKLLGACLPNG